MSQHIKVGFFVFLGLVLVTAIVFMIGDSRNFWEAKVSYVAAFKDVAGLRPGAPVRLGGVDIGNVKHVRYAESSTDTRIHVEFAIVKHEAVRIRQGTIAGIVNKGLLGDKMVELRVPDPAAPMLPPGGELIGETPQDITKYMDKIGPIADSAQQTLDNLATATKPLADPKLAKDLKESVSSMNEILDAIAHKDTAAHRLLVDPTEGPKLDKLLTDLDVATRELGQSLADVHDVTTHMREGPGLVHSMVYDGEVSEHVAGALAEVHKDLQAIREGNGIAHALIYGDDNTQHVMTNLNAMSDDLRKIVADIRAGKGTLGALLVDPSVYEDIKGAVGNVERNEVLRALVRYSIKQDEHKPAAAPAPPK